VIILGDNLKNPSMVDFNYPQDLIPPQNELYRAFSFKGFGHSGSIETIAISSDNKYFVTGDSHGRINVWEFKTKKLIRTFGHAGMISKIIITSDNKYLISCANNNFIYIREFPIGKIVKKLVAEKSGESSASFIAIALSPNEKFLITGALDEENQEINSIQVWKFPIAELIHTIYTGKEGPNNLAITTDNKYIIAIIGWDPFIHIWDLTSGAFIRKFPEICTALLCITISPQDNHVYTGDFNGIITQWDFQTGLPLKELKVSDTEIKDIKFTSDGKYLVCCSSGLIKEEIKGEYSNFLHNYGNIVIINLANFSIVRTIIDKKNGDAFASIAITQDNKYIISGDYFNKSLIRIWDFDKGHLIHTIKGLSHKNIASISILPDNKTCFVASHHPYIQVFDITNGKLIKKHKISNDLVWQAKLTPDGKRLVTSSRENNIKIWDSENFNLIHTFDEIPLYEPFSINPSGEYVACQSGVVERVIKILDIKNMKILDTEIYDEDISFVEFTPNGNLVTVSYESTIKEWDFKTANLIRYFKRSSGGTNCAISPDGKYLVSNPKWNDLYLWDFESGKLLSIFKRHDGIIDQMRFSYDGKLLASADSEGQVIVWDLPKRIGYGPFLHSARVNALEFLSSGNFVITGDKNGDVKIWEFHKGPTFDFSFEMEGEQELPKTKDVTPEDFVDNDYLRIVDMLMKKKDYNQVDIVKYWYNKGWNSCLQFCGLKFATALQEFLEEFNLTSPYYYQDLMKRIEFLPRDIPKAITSPERRIDLSELTKKTPEQELFEKIGGVFKEVIGQEIPYEDLGILLGTPEFMRSAMESRDNIIRNLFDLLFLDFSNIIIRSLETIENPEKIEFVKKIIIDKINELRHLIE